MIEPTDTLLGLPDELWYQIGSHLPDTKSVVAFSRTSKQLCGHRYRLLTHNFPMLESLLQSIVSKTKTLPDSFVEACSTSPYRNKEIILGYYCEKINERLTNQIRFLFPKAVLVKFDFAQREDYVPIVMCGGGGGYPPELSKYPRFKLEDYSITERRSSITELFKVYQEATCPSVLDSLRQKSLFQVKTQYKLPDFDQNNYSSKLDNLFQECVKDYTFDPSKPKSLFTHACEFISGWFTGLKSI